MDKSNPKLFQWLHSFRLQSAPGVDAFIQAQAIYGPGHTTRNGDKRASSNSISGSLDAKLSPCLESNSHLSNDIWTPSVFESDHPASYPEGMGYYLLRAPFLFIVCGIMYLEAILYCFLRQCVAVWEYLYVWRGKLGSLRQDLREARSYEEWKQAALALDTYMGKDEWRNQPNMAYYDYSLINNLLVKTIEFRKTGQVEKLMEILLQAGLRSNVGNIDSVRLYSNTYHGTKKVVEQFLTEVTESLHYVGSSPNLSSSVKKQFFRAAFRNYGRSALCLSGGACLAYFHFGVVRTLLDSNMLPKIITGTSAGSMVAALIACRSDDELRELLNPDMHVMIDACEEPRLVLLRRLITAGTIFEARDFAEKCQWVTKGHTTFLEAYRMTGKILNVTAVPYNSYGPAKLLNYLSTPDVVIWSAVLASSSLPGVLEPITLMVKKEDGTLEPYLGPGVKWRDGSFKTDIPIESLKSQFNVKYTIVSQANPHVAVFYYENRGSVGRPAAHRFGKGWRGGFLASSLEHFLKLDLKKWLRVLRDLELLPFVMKQDFSNLWLQKFDGNATIFPFFNPYNYLHIISDPTLESMEDYIRSGTIKTWPKLHKIRNHTKIEHTIFYWLNSLYNAKGQDSVADIPRNAHMLPDGSIDDLCYAESAGLGICPDSIYSKLAHDGLSGLHDDLLENVMDLACNDEFDSNQ